jgi:hypothetical protein
MSSISTSALLEATFANSLLGIRQLAKIILAKFRFPIYLTKNHRFQHNLYLFEYHLNIKPVLLIYTIESDSHLYIYFFRHHQKREKVNNNNNTQRIEKKNEPWQNEYEEKYLYSDIYIIRRQEKKEEKYVNNHNMQRSLSAVVYWKKKH